MAAVLAAALLVVCSACSGSSSKATADSGVSTATDAESSGLVTDGHPSDARDSDDLASDGQDSRSGDGSDEFVADVTSACERKYNTRIAGEEEGDAQYDPNTPEWAATQAEALHDAIKAELDELSELTPPSELADAWNDYVVLLEDDLADARAELEAAQGHDPDGFSSAAAEIDSRVQEEKPLEEELGIEDCRGHGISSADADAVEKVVEEVFLTSEPSLCTENMTPGYVRQHFGSEADCERSQRNPSGTAPAAQVTDIAGLGDVAWFTLEVEPSEADLANDPSLEGKTLKGQAIAYRQHGHWRLQAEHLQPTGGAAG